MYDEPETIEVRCGWCQGLYEVTLPMESSDLYCSDECEQHAKVWQYENEHDDFAGDR